LVDKAVNKKLDGIAITDHDTIDGIARAIVHGDKYKDFLIVPGIEFSCAYNEDEAHILGYFIDYKDRRLISKLEELKSSRWERGEKILNRLIEIGLDVPKQKILDEARSNGFIGRATIARKLVEYGYAKDVPNAFDLYLDKGKPAFIDRYKLSVEETIELIHAVGGISILAHPGLLKHKETVTFCIEKGIMGIECRHTKHTKEQQIYYSELCKSKGLIETGGSDFHGDESILGSIVTDIDLIPTFMEKTK
jgi:predicted metal-dependent phosphoesterase TrpH